MPFKNKAQEQACFAQRRKDIINGKKPGWDCYKWLAEEAKHRKLVKEGKLRNEIHIGPKGGKYKIYMGRKIYL